MRVWIVSPDFSSGQIEITWFLLVLFRPCVLHRRHKPCFFLLPFSPLVFLFCPVACFCAFVFVRVRCWLTHLGSLDCTRTRSLQPYKGICFFFVSHQKMNKMIQFKPNTHILEIKLEKTSLLLQPFKWRVSFECCVCV